MISGPSKNGARIVTLQGDLGAGKTTFTQGFVLGFGVRGKVTSPTFTLMRTFRVRRGPFGHIYHIDAYRLEEEDAARDLEISKILEEKESIVVVEWPENIRKILPKKTLDVIFEHGANENERTIKIPRLS
jgi:tRNA threonylcarbamoyladenosine biosynthesis protein TsaE